jgi:hypothetical protein
MFRTGNAILRHCAVLAIGTLMLGCAANWHDNNKDFLDPYENGDLNKAAAEATRCAKDGVAHDKVILNLEAGAILRAAGLLPESTAALDAADALVGDYTHWSEVRLSEEVAAATTTVRNVNYRGTLGDLIMLNVYRALNAMEQGQFDLARTSLIRSSFVQQDIATKYAFALSDAQQKLDARKREASQKGEYNVDRTLQAKVDGDMTIEQRLVADSGLNNMRASASYVDPFCDYLQGIYFLSAGVDASDRERAAVAFKRVAGMVPDNPYVLQDVAEAERVANGQARSSVTYVLFETGLAPYRDQVQISLPLFIFNNQVPSVVIYFPTIHEHDGHVRNLQVMAGGGVYTSAVVSDMDAIIKQEFRNQLPTIITRMIIGAATKAAIDAASKQALKDQDASIQLAGSIGMLLYQAAFNQADLRSWRTLPKQFQVARVPTPSDHNLSIRLGNGAYTVPVHLGEGKTNVVYVKSIRAGVPPIVRSFMLN